MLFVYLVVKQGKLRKVFGTTLFFTSFLEKKKNSGGLGSMWFILSEPLELDFCSWLFTGDWSNRKQLIQELSWIQADLLFSKSLQAQLKTSVFFSKLGFPELSKH